MIDDMGIFRTDIAIENPFRPDETRSVKAVMVDTGSELTWVPRSLLEALGVTRRWTQRFRVADGRTLERDIGFAIVHAAGATTIDQVVFAEPTDMVLLGARTLEGLNLRIDIVSKELVDAGPIITGAAAA